MQHIPASAIGATVFSKFLHYVDPLLMRISKDRLSIPSLLTGLPVVIDTCTGAKSGQARTKPVIGIPQSRQCRFSCLKLGTKAQSRLVL